MLTILISFALVITVAFTCSLFEAVLLSLSPAFVEVKAESRSRGGRLLKHIFNNKERSISAILTLNTISHTLGSAWIDFEVHEAYGETWVTTGSIALTFFILI